MVAILGLIMSALALGSTPAAKSANAAQIAAGQTLAQTQCATCHAIGKRGKSPNPQAPRFATLNQRYPLDNLAEAFSEGILVGHGPMPEFSFEPDQVEGLIAYLKSVQKPVKRPKKRVRK